MSAILKGTLQITVITLVSILMCSQVVRSQHVHHAPVAHVKAPVKMPPATDYYMYNRTANSYNGLFISASGSDTKAKPVYQLNMVYTAASPATAVIFTASADTTKRLTASLIDDGTQPIDNKNLTSYKYHIYLTADMLAFFSTHTIKKVSLTNGSGLILIALHVDNPAFISQQLNNIKNSSSRKLLRPKMVTNKQGSKKS